MTCNKVTIVLDGLDWGQGITEDLPRVDMGCLGEKKMLHKCGAYSVCRFY